MTGERPKYLTVTKAAARVKRTRRTIERWIDDGLPVVPVNGIRYVEEKQLLAVLREREAADPAKAREIGTDERRSHRVTKNLQRRHAGK